MTITYDPGHVLYTNEYDVRLETARVFDVCVSCQQCVLLCPTFPALFSLVQTKIDVDAGRLTPVEQDEVMHHCFRCTMCSSLCPYTPDQHERAVDFPRLVDRYRAMQKKNRTLSMRSRIGRVILGRSWQSTRFLGHLKPGGVVRQLVARVAGISARSELPRRATKTLSALFVSRTAMPSKNVLLFPTCVVETIKPEIGEALVEAYEHNGIGCLLVAPDRCCGAPALVHGDIAAFMKTAAHNVEVFAAAVRNGNDIVVPNPSCFSVITTDYPHYLNSDDSRLVALHMFDSLDYFTRSVDESGQSSDSGMSDAQASSFAHHVPMEMHARALADRGRTLLSLTGANVGDVSLNSGREYGWHLHVDNELVADNLVREFEEKMDAIGADVAVSDSPWVAKAKKSCDQPEVLHTWEVLARAYGLSK